MNSKSNAVLDPATRKALEKWFNKQPTDAGKEEFDELVSIVAASRLEAISEAEPDGWQHRIYYEDTGKWSEWRDGKWNLRKTLVNKFEERPLYAHTPPAGHVVVPVDGWKPPDDCDGIEQDAFEAWAASERYDMEQHPLHWLFLNAQTAAARNGWRAGIRHARDRYRAMLAALPHNKGGAK